MRRWAILLLTAALVAMVMAVGTSERPIHAATRPPFTVNSTADPGTGGCDATECTLREAINASNNATGADTIEFDITGAGPHTITPASPLPDITSPVTIDGYTQGDGTPGNPSDDATQNTLAVGNNAVLKIELSGANLPPPAPPGIGPNGLNIKAPNSTVKGMVINRFGVGLSISGSGATGNKVQGNFIGTNPSGTADLGNTQHGILIEEGASNNAIGGTVESARNTISGNDDVGVFISSTAGTGNKVLGNYIGTKANGIEALGTVNYGVDASTNNNTVGGTVAGARNVISGNNGYGVYILGTGNKVQGNFVGTSTDGTAPLGNNNGVVIDGVSNNTIGGKTAAARNVISGNGGDGVELFGNSSGTTGNRIRSNSIYENDALGINLVHINDAPDDGATPNDNGDGDVGPNYMQNFPVIDSATLATRKIGGHRRKVTIIKGSLNGNANTTFTLQFFGSLEEDPSHFGEGKMFLGQKSGVTTDDSSGDASFTFMSRKKVPRGQVVTATASVTATPPNPTNQSVGDTSEFSRAVSVS